jgi:DNA modification methylase
VSVRILVGDVREKLAELPDESVQCVVTSPPYWGLRDYGVQGQIGLEPTFGAFLETMVDVFREVRRVLRRDGVAWLNMGDSYAGSWGAQSRGGPPSDKSTLRGNGHIGGGPKIKGLSAAQIEAAPKSTHTGSNKRAPGLKPKDRMMMPARLAIALQEDGWWLRDEIVWHKPNPMPSSVEDRTTPAHEMLYLLSRSARYHYDGNAIREPFAQSSIQRLTQPTIGEQRGGDKQDAYASAGLNERNGSRRPNEIVAGLAQRITRKPAGWDTADGSHSTLRHARGKSGNKERKLGVDRGRPDSHIAGSVPWEGADRNKRSVWTIATEAFPDAHFATFPTALVEPCIKAGCPVGGMVLDPFGGAGTTGLVADRLQRNAILIELNPEYAEIARRRIHGDAPMFAEVGA